MKTMYDLKVIRKDLNRVKTRKALFTILTEGDDAAFVRQLTRFAKAWMLNEADKFVDLRNKAKAGVLTLDNVRF